MRANRKEPEIILRDGKPRAVIIDIDEYQEMLERLEDTEDLRVLEEMGRAHSNSRDWKIFSMNTAQAYVVYLERAAEQDSNGYQRGIFRGLSPVSGLWLRIPDP